MSLKWRLFCALALGIVCLGLLGSALAWQSRLHAQQQQTRLLLEIQGHAWQQLQAEQMAQLEALAAQLVAGYSQASTQTLQLGMQALTNHHPGLRIDLFDASVNLLASTASGVNPEPMLDPTSIARWIQQLLQVQGLQQLSARQYHWLQLTRVGPHVLVLGLDAAAVLPLLAQRLAGEFAILNMRGTPLASSTADDRLFALNLVPARVAQVLTLDTGDPRLAGRPALQLISQPLTGANASVIGSLAWTRQAGAGRHQDRLFLQRTAVQIGAVLLLVLGGLFLLLRHALDPLARNVDVLQSLAQGHSDVALHAGEADAEDESGSIARSMMQVRSELLSLETLRQERVRTQRQQERLIRDQLRSLAESLDPASRQEILQALGAQQGENARAPAEASHALADLASILGQMSGLVSTQQSRLLKLLREVQASVQTQAMLASLQQELEIARQMQLSILPRQTPDRHEIDIASTMIPAKEIGGDFYDYFAIDSDHLAIVIADVSGKGVPAAFFMAISRTLLKSNGLFLRTPGATIAALNDQLCAENDQMMFVTVFYAVLQLSSGQLTYVNAGHNPPILRRQGEAQFFPKGRNMGLAVIENQNYHEGTLQLAAGDSLLLYTDGVTEATDTHNALFGDARLLQVVQSLAPLPDQASQARLLTDAIVQAVRVFEAGAAQADDITVVALTYRGPTV